MINKKAGRATCLFGCPEDAHGLAQGAGVKSRTNGSERGPSLRVAPTAHIFPDGNADTAYNSLSKGLVTSRPGAYWVLLPSTFGLGTCDQTLPSQRMTSVSNFPLVYWFVC